MAETIPPKVGVFYEKVPSLILIVKIAFLIKATDSQTVKKRTETRSLTAQKPLRCYPACFPLLLAPACL